MIKISFIIPTLNAQKVLETCLKSIIKQDFPKSNYEIIIVDGGSTDKTIDIAHKYNSIILNNPLKTAEAGKAVGVRQAKGEFICLIDSDNILPTKNWLKKMLYPFSQNPKIIGSEPIKFTYRKNAGIIERYSALIGANDPYAFISGVYDRQNYINSKWTGLKVSQTDKKEFIEITLKPKTIIPTIGANGTIFRTDFLKNNLKSDYFFDIDMISSALKQTRQPIFFAKVKQGIIHTYCENSLSKFIRKQNRRIVDYYFYQQQRQFNWSKPNRYAIIKFIFYIVLIFPMVFDIFRGFIHQPDIVWFFHPLACIITIYIYGVNSVKHRFNLLRQIDRTTWKQ